MPGKGLDSWALGWKACCILPFLHAASALGGFAIRKPLEIRNPYLKPDMKPWGNPTTTLGVSPIWAPSGFQGWWGKPPQPEHQRNSYSVPAVRYQHPPYRPSGPKGAAARVRGPRMRKQVVDEPSDWQPSMDVPIVLPPARITGDDLDGDGLPDQDDNPDSDDNLNNAEDLPIIAVNREKRKMIVPVKTMADDYGHYAASQLSYLRMLLPDLLGALKPGSVLFDFGCADALNFLELVTALKQNTSNFSLGFVDFPENNWERVRDNIKWTVGRIQPDTGFSQPPQKGLPSSVFGPPVVLVGGNFYEQIAPSGSVDIAISTTAVHFLSEGKARPQMQAAKDWLNFLENRQLELNSGGVLFVIAPAKRENLDPEQSFIATNQVLRNTIAQASTDGLISKAMGNNWFFPGHARTKHEWKLPFDRGLVPNLDLDSFEIVALSSPYWDTANHDPVKFAALYVPSVMAWLGAYMQTTLGQQVVDNFAQNLRKAIMDNPQDFTEDYVQAILKIRKLEPVT